MADIRFTTDMALELAGCDGVFPVEFPEGTGKDLDDRMASMPEAGERFLGAGALLPEDAFLGWQVGARGEEAGQMVVFSGPGRQAAQEDLRWVFEDAAEIGSFRDGKPEDLRGEGRRLYLICMDAKESMEAQGSMDAKGSMEAPGKAPSDLPVPGKDNGSRMGRKKFLWDFIKAVKDSGGIARGILQGGRSNRGMLLISLREEISLWMRSMLSMAIPGADAVEIRADGTGLCRTEGLSGSVMSFCTAETLREHCMEAVVEAENTSISEDTPIKELELSVRSMNCLLRAGIRTLGELCALRPEEIAGIRNIGKKGVDEVLAMLHRLADACSGETGTQDGKDFRKAHFLRYLG